MKVFETLGFLRSAMRRAKTLALLTFLVPFSALGAYAQYEAGNMPLVVMYLVLGPIVAAGCCLAWRNTLSAVSTFRASPPASPTTRAK